MADTAAPLDFLRTLTPATSPADAFTANAHIHLPPNFSAFPSVADAVTDTVQQGVAVLGASNYYDYTVYTDFAGQCRTNGIFPLFGLEIITLREDLRRDGVKVNDPGNPGKMYLCGKGISRFTPMTSEAAQLLQVIRDNDSRRMAEMTAELADHFTAHGVLTMLDADRIRAQVAAHHGCGVETVYLQERHIARAFQEVLFAVPLEERAEAIVRIFDGASRATPEDAAKVQADIRSHLMKAGKPAFVEETFVTPEHATRLILALGGIPCYPTLADGTSPVCTFEDPVASLITHLKAEGITCAEFIPVRNSAEVLSHYVLALREAGIVVTAGTEHNTPDRIPITPTCLNGAPIPPDVDAIFHEGTCVIIAHQYLTARGETGFVSDDGIPNPSYATTEDRIAAFTDLGARLLQAYGATAPSLSCSSC